MKTFFKIIGWILFIPVCIVFIFALLGFMAIRFDFWPPTCSVLPIPQARNVCEYSKLDKAPKGRPANITFWVTVPFTTPATDTVLLAIKNRDPIKMSRVNATTFRTSIDETTGTTLDYSYLRNDANSTSDTKKYVVKSFEKTLYDYVSDWSDLKTQTAIPGGMLPIVEMYDTWSINYNMQFFEDTRKNLDRTMARIREMGGKEIGVYNFIVMSGNEENFTVQEAPSMPNNIFGQLKNKFGRDASITEGEMKRISKTAKKYGLKTTMYYNIWADPTKYIVITANPFAARGSGGSAAEKRAGDDFGRYKPKTKEWLDRYFSQLQGVLVEWARRAESSGIDAIDVNPHYRPPTTAPLEEYAGAKWLDIIKAIREVYRGKIYSDGNPSYRDSVDGLYYSTGITVRADATVAEMRDAWKNALRSIDTKFAGYNKPVFIMIGPGSYTGALSGKPGMEFLDYVEVAAAGYTRDWQSQADAYEAFFQALSEGTKAAGFGTRFLSWDDMMGPDYIPSRYSDLASNIRNKPAEAVFRKWVLPLTK